MVSSKGRKGSTKSPKNVELTEENEENQKKSKKRHSDRIQKNHDTSYTEDQTRSDTSLNTSSLEIEIESSMTSTSHEQKNVLLQDDDTVSDTSVSSMCSDYKQSSSSHQTGHQISDSETGTDNEIQEIAKSHAINDALDDMSDFSIQSPPKKKGTPVQKKLSGSFWEDPVTSKKKVKGKKSKTKEVEDSCLSSTSPQKKEKQTSPSKSSRKEAMVEECIIEQDLNMRYKIPEGFEPTKLTVSNQDLCKEDLDGKELWLIKAPIDFDIQQLSDIDIDLNGTVDFQTKSDFYECIGTPDRTHEMTLFNAVLPSKEKSSFTVGPRFKGQIHVMQSIDIPSLPSIQKPEPVIHEIPVGLIPRFEPFGSDSPILMKKRKHHHHHHQSHQDQTDLSASPDVHKRKHKLEKNETDLGQSEVKKVKKEKKKKR